MAGQGLVNWNKVLGWHSYRPALRKHGLVDCLTMLSALEDAERGAREVLEKSGRSVIAHWLLRQDEPPAAVQPVCGCMTGGDRRRLRSRCTCVKI